MGPEIPLANREGGEILKKPAPWVIFDYDGVLGRFPGYFKPDLQELGEMCKTIGGFVDKGWKLGLLTNRSAFDMQPLASLLGIGGWIGAENGAVAMDTNDPYFLTKIHPKFSEYVNSGRQKLLEALFKTGLVSPNFTDTENPFRIYPSHQVKVVLIPREGLSNDVLNNAISQLEEEVRKVLEEEKIVMKIGKGIDFDPKGLDKAFGMRWFLELNDVDPNRSIFIADAPRDISAAEVLLNRGGYFGIVANASNEVIEWGRGKDRVIIAPSKTEYHASVSGILSQFLAGLESIKD